MEEKEVLKKFNSIEEIREEGLELLFKDELISSNLKELMDKRMLTVENMASAIETTTQTIYQFLNNPGNIKAKDLAKIATVLEVKLDDLINIDESKWYRHYPAKEGQYFLDLKSLEVISYNEKFTRRKEDNQIFYYFIEEKCISQSEYTELKNSYIKKKKEESIKESGGFDLKQAKIDFDKICNSRYPYLIYKTNPPKLNLDLSKYGL